MLSILSVKTFKNFSQVSVVEAEIAGAAVAAGFKIELIVLNSILDL